MSLHYQVDVSFSLTHGKPKLVKIALYTTTATCTTIPIFENSILNHYYILPNLREVKYYIFCLYRAHPDSKAGFPKLDASQLLLFNEL